MVNSELSMASSSRLFFSRARGYPNVVCSVVKYVPEAETARFPLIIGPFNFYCYVFLNTYYLKIRLLYLGRLQRQRAEDTKGLEVFEVSRRDWRGLSYQLLLKRTVDEARADDWVEKGYMHDPNWLDDPELVHGSAKQLKIGNATTEALPDETIAPPKRIYTLHLPVVLIYCTSFSHALNLCVVLTLSTWDR